jgi:peptide/nickel transport system permease protein
LALGSMIVLLFVILLAFVGAAMWKYNYTETSPRVDGRGAPTLDAIPFIDGDGLAVGEHPFGQDDIGRDYFALTLRGTQQSLIIATLAGLVGTFIGTAIGAIAGFYRGRVDNILMRFVDIGLTIPLLLLAAVIGRRAGDIPGLSWLFGENSVLLFGKDPDDVPVIGDYFGPNSIILLGLVIAFVSWLTIARVVRGEFLSLREKEYVEAARAIIVNATLLISAAILIETALSYLGLGVRGDDWSLGKLVSSYQNAFTTRPWLFWWPGLFILVIALCINFIGDGLRDAFDPRQTRERR